VYFGFFCGIGVLHVLVVEYAEDGEDGERWNQSNFLWCLIAGPLGGCVGFDELCLFVLDVF
jgi:uncharacterized membrane protein YdcZ (DUF606 family)